MPSIIILGGGSADTSAFTASRTESLVIGESREIDFARSRADGLVVGDKHLAKYTRKRSESIAIGDSHNGFLLRFSRSAGVRIDDSHIGIRQIQTRADGLVVGDVHTGVNRTISRSDGLRISDVHAGTLFFPVSRSDGLVVGDAHDGWNQTAVLNQYGDRIQYTYSVEIKSSAGVISPPISSFSGTKKTGAPSNLQVVIPDGPTWAEAIADYADGSITLYENWSVGGVQLVSVELFSVDITDVSVYQGAVGYTINIQGKRTSRRIGNEITLPAQNYRATSKGRLTVRLPKISYDIRPGDYFVEDESEIYIESVRFTMSGSGAPVTEIREGAKPCDETDLMIEDREGIISFSAGADHTMILKSSGIVCGWGDNRYGQVDPTESPLFGLASNWHEYTGYQDFAKSQKTGIAKLHCGESRTFAITNAGLLYGWGLNNFNQVTPDYSDPGTPQQSTVTYWIEKDEEILAGVDSVSTGDSHTMVLLENNDVVGWGENDFGQVDPTSSSDYVIEKTSVIISNIEKICASHDFTLAIKTNGDLLLWGDANYFAGLIPEYDEENPFQTPILRDVASVGAGYRHIAAVTHDWALKCCGENHLDFNRTIMTGVKTIACGSYHTMMVKTCGDLYGFGHNLYGQINPFVTPALRYDDVDEVIMTDVLSVHCGTWHTIVVKKDLTVYGWGWNKTRWAGVTIDPAFQADPRNVTPDPTTPITQL